jgi:hypothetical protein
MRLFITICGETCKTSVSGQPYGWPVNIFCPIERFFGEDTFLLSRQISPREATEKITAQIKTLNPHAEDKAIQKFIGGSL